MTIASKIVPTILVDSIQNYESAVTQINSFAKRVQVDITDGQFTENKTVKLDQVFWPNDWVVDIHMMVDQPSFYIKNLSRMKPHLVIFHAEAKENLLPIFGQLREAGIRAGVALLRPTVPNNVAELIKRADHVLVFAGELGKMGGAVSLLQREKVRLIRKINPNVEIGWDGGANVDNIFSISRSGVDIINVGSALAYANDPKAVFEELKAQVAKTSVV